MSQADTEIFLPIVIMGMIFTAGAVISISVTWLQSRPKMQMIQVLKAYAEKGEEPPAAVIETLAKLSWPFPPPPPKPKQTRAYHLAHLAGSIGMGLGCGAVVLWRWPAESQHPGPLLVIAVALTIFFAASIAPRLVGVFTTRDGD